MAKKQVKKKALTKNQEMLKRQAKRANDKMRTMEKNKVDIKELNEAKQWLANNTNRARFSTNPSKLKYNEVMKELAQVNKFLEAKAPRVRKEVVKKPLTKNQELLKKLSIKANKKMVTLEKYGVEKMAKSDDKDKSYDTPALRQAKQWLRDNTDGRTRFSTNPAKLTYKEVQRELYRVNKFLNAKSSEVVGFEDTIALRDATFIAKGFQEEDLPKVYDFFKSKLYKHMLGGLSSDQIVDFLTNNPDYLNYEYIEQVSTKEKIRTNRYFGKKKVFEDVVDPEELEEQETFFNK